MRTVFRKSLICMLSILFVLCSCPANAMGGLATGKDQLIEFQNKHYGPMLVSFIQEGELAETQYVTYVILNTGQKIRYKFNQGENQGNRVIQIRHFGGIWEMNIASDTTSLSSKDVIKEANCLKPDFWGKKE